MTSTIQKFPTELLVLIFKSLNLTDIETCLKTCMKWREIIAQFILQTSLKKLSKFDENLYNQFCGYGWFQDYFNDTELIISLYKKTYFQIWIPISRYNKFPHNPKLMDTKKILEILFTQNKLKGSYSNAKIIIMKFKNENKISLQFKGNIELIENITKLEAKYGIPGTARLCQQIIMIRTVLI